MGPLWILSNLLFPDMKSKHRKAVSQCSSSSSVTGESFGGLSINLTASVCICLTVSLLYLLSLFWLSSCLSCIGLNSLYWGKNEVAEEAGELTESTRKIRSMHDVKVERSGHLHPGSCFSPPCLPGTEMKTY